MKKYWIKYTDGTKTYFNARDYDQALIHAISDGDHVLEFGEVQRSEATNEPSNSVKDTKDT